MEPSADLIPPAQRSQPLRLSLSAKALHNTVLLPLWRSAAQGSPPQSQFAIPSVCLFLQTAATCTSLTSCTGLLQRSGTLDRVALELMASRIRRLRFQAAALIALDHACSRSLDQQSPILFRPVEAPAAALPQNSQLASPPAQADAEQTVPSAKSEIPRSRIGQHLVELLPLVQSVFLEGKKRIPSARPLRPRPPTPWTTPAKTTSPPHLSRPRGRRPNSCRGPAVRHSAQTGNFCFAPKAPAVARCARQLPGQRIPAPGCRGVGARRVFPRTRGSALSASRRRCPILTDRTCTRRRGMAARSFPTDSSLSRCGWRLAGPIGRLPARRTPPAHIAAPGRQSANRHPSDWPTAQDVSIHGTARGIQTSAACSRSGRAIFLLQQGYVEIGGRRAAARPFRPPARDRGRQPRRSPPAEIRILALHACILVDSGSSGACLDTSGTFRDAVQTELSLSSAPPCERRALADPIRGPTSFWMCAPFDRARQSVAEGRVQLPRFCGASWSEVQTPRGRNGSGSRPSRPQSGSRQAAERSAIRGGRRNGRALRVDFRRPAGEGSPGRRAVRGVVSWNALVHELTALVGLLRPGRRDFAVTPPPLEDF